MDRLSGMITNFDFMRHTDITYHDQCAGRLHHTLVNSNNDQGKEIILLHAVLIEARMGQVGKIWVVEVDRGWEARG